MSTSSERVEVAFPFSSTDPDQLQLTLGESIEVIKKTSTGWWIGRDGRGNVGSFLVNYTRPVRERPKFAVTKEFKTAQLVSSSVSSSSSTALAAASAGGNNGSGGGFYHNMSKGDSQQLKELLGLDDEDDDEDNFDNDSPNRAGALDGHHKPSTALQNSNEKKKRRKRAGGSPEHRHALESLLASTFENTAGNHRSLNEGRPGRHQHQQGGGGYLHHHHASHSSSSNHPLVAPATSGGGGGGGELSLSLRSASSSCWDSGGSFRSTHSVAALRRIHGGDASPSSLVDQVISLRKEIARESAVHQKLQTKESSLKRAHDVDVHALEELQRQVVLVKLHVQERQAIVADFEKRIEVLRCVSDGEASSLPAYDPNELDRTLQRLRQPAGDAAAVASSSPLSPNNMTILSSTPALAGVPAAATVVLQTVAPPSEELLASDPAAKRMVRKLNKRIAEAEETKESYSKQRAKADKRIGKFRTSLQQIEEEIALLRSTLLLGGQGKGGQHHNDDDDDGTVVSSSAAASEDESQPPRPTKATSDVAESRLERVFRRLVRTLTDEEQADIERYQLAELKLQQKCAKLREQLEGDSNEVSAFRARIEKLKKLLGKGDHAMEELVGQREELQRSIQRVGASAKVAAENYNAAQKALGDAHEALQSAKKLRDAALVKRKSDREALLGRIEKEQKRVAEFEAELVRLKTASLAVISK